MGNKLTLTINETAALCREHGWAVGKEQLAEGIAEGRYPFGKILRVGNTGRRTYEIWKADVLAYLREKGAEV